MSVNLTPNAIASVVGGDVNLRPLVQILDIQPIVDSRNRYKIVLSDGASTQQGMLAAQLGDYVRHGKVQKGSVVQLIDYLCSSVRDDKFIVVLNMQTIVESCHIIGNPIPSGFEQTLQVTPLVNLSKQGGNADKGTSRSFTSLGVYSNLSDKNENIQPVVQQPYQAPPVYRNHGAVVKNLTPAHIIPIAALNPYQGLWTIKARVTAKGDVRRYNNAKGDGKVFSFDLLDSEGGQIRATCFNSVVDRFFSSVEVGKVYMISKGSLKPAQKNFNHLNNDWEIFLDGSSGVVLCLDEDSLIPKQHFSFRFINEIECLKNNSVVDIIGIVIAVNPSVPILRKNGLETQRRIVSLKDSSGKCVELTLWGDFCHREGRKLQEMHDSGSFPVLAVKSAKVNDFNGKTVGTIFSTQLFIDPDLSEAQIVKAWFEGGGKDTVSQSISWDIIPQNEIRKTISQIKEEGLGRSERPDWITVKATVTFIKTDTFCYTACPLMVGDRQCGKKVTQSIVRGWRCDRCDQEFEQCDYRYILQVQVQDHTGLTWVTAFQEAGEELLHTSAKELYLLKYEDHDDVRFGEVVRNNLFNEYLLKLKIKEESYGDEQRVKITVLKVERLNFSFESARVLDLLSRDIYMG